MAGSRTKSATIQRGVIEQARQFLETLPDKPQVKEALKQQLTKPAAN